MSTMRFHQARLTLAGTLLGVLLFVGPGSSSKSEIIKTCLVNYETHDDKFYLSADMEKTFERDNFYKTQKKEGKTSAHAFAVAQSSLARSHRSIMMDRWDVKEVALNRADAEYFALYHGTRDPHLVNQVRARLLPELATSLNYLLTSSAGAGIDELAFRSMVGRVFNNVERDIRKEMNPSDESSASATIVILTSSYIITVGVGGGQVIAYDEKLVRTNLSSDRRTGADRPFGSRQKRMAALEPHVEFHSRPERDYKFLFLMTPLLAPHFNPKAVATFLQSSMHDYEHNVTKICSETAGRIIKLVKPSQPVWKFLFNAKNLELDYSIMLVALDSKI